MILRVQDNELRVLSRDEAVRQAQELLSGFQPEGGLVSDELIAERRKEASAELEG